MDGDGIPFRTYPGTHPTKGAYFTRGTSKNAYAAYSEAGPDYLYNMQRLLKKYDTAKTLVPKPVLTPAKEPARFGAIYYGSTSPSMQEALEALARQGHLRQRAARARLPVPGRDLRLRRSRTPRCSWSSRTATRS